MIISNSSEETFSLGRDHAAGLTANSVLVLSGDLGAGKTQFVKGLAAGLGHAGAVTSPTFTLIHEYRGGRLPLFHIDLYRLETPAEALAIGLEEYFESGGVVALEWGDKFPEILPAQSRWLRFQVLDGDRRAIEL